MGYRMMGGNKGHFGGCGTSKFDKKMAFGVKLATMLKSAHKLMKNFVKREGGRKGSQQSVKSTNLKNWWMMLRLQCGHIAHFEIKGSKTM